MPFMPGMLFVGIESCEGTVRRLEEVGFEGRLEAMFDKAGVSGFRPMTVKLSYKSADPKLTTLGTLTVADMSG